MGLFKGCLSVYSFRTSKIVIFNDIRKYFGVFFHKITGVDFTAQGHSPKRNYLDTCSENKPPDFRHANTAKPLQNTKELNGMLPPLGGREGGRMGVRGSARSAPDEERFDHWKRWGVLGGSIASSPQIKQGGSQGLPERDAAPKGRNGVGVKKGSTDFVCINVTANGVGGGASPKGDGQGGRNKRL